jgi:hypothetical protein
MPDIIDVSFDCGTHADFLAGAGVKTIIRYYSRDTGLPAKRLTRKEAEAFVRAGLRIGVVHEAKRGDSIESFTGALGQLDAVYARQYGAKVIGQPEGSAIFFAVDFDAGENEVRDSILPYFKAIADAFALSDGLPRYQIGVYGSGAVCGKILDAGLASLAWLAQSTGWSAFKQFRDSNRWALRQMAETSVGEIDCDPDVANVAQPQFGDFTLDLSGSVAGARLTVIAREGLRLRAGPGTEFDILRVLPFGTSVNPLKTVGDWTLVDLEGDKAGDGFVSTHFLAAT